MKLTDGFVYILQPATELIKEIAVLELEVSHLEQYLLSLYRKAFDQQSSSVSPKQQTPSSPKSTLRGKRLDFSTTTPEQPRCVSFDNRLKSPCMVKKEPDSPSLSCRQDNLAMEEPRCFSFDSRLKEPGSAARKLNQEGSTECFSFDNRPMQPGSAASKLIQEGSTECFSFENKLMQPGSAARKLTQESSTIDSRCFSFDNRLKDQSLYEEEDIDSCVRRCQSTLNQRSTFNNRISPPEVSLTLSYHYIIRVNKACNLYSLF